MEPTSALLSHGMAPVTGGYEAQSPEQGANPSKAVPRPQQPGIATTSMLLCLSLTWLGLITASPPLSPVAEAYDEHHDAVAARHLSRLRGGTHYPLKPRAAS